MKQISLTQSQIDTIVRGNFSRSKIKEYLNISWPTVKVICKKYNIIPDLDRRTYKPNDNYFKIWSEEMAYFLGLIAADGHVRRQNNFLMLSLKKTDEKIIENLKEALQYSGPLYTINKKDGQTQCCLTVCSKEIVTDLNNLGLSGNKTFDFDWINGMEDKYVSHFVRGMFDGDGCIYINEKKGNFETTIIGTDKLTENIKNKYDLFSKKYSGHLAKRGKVQSLDFNGKYNALAFLDWIYTNSTQSTRLERKYELYLKLKNTICEEEKPNNNAHIDQDTANKIREIYSTGVTVKEISNQLDISESIIHDVTSNRTWTDPTYTPGKKKQDTISITYNNKTQSIKEWSNELGIPYSTIDRRYRENLPIDQVMSTKELPKTKSTQSEKDKKAYELAHNLRTDYKNGSQGKSLYEKYNVPKSRAMDILANRTCKDENVWWK